MPPERSSIKKQEQFRLALAIEDIGFRSNMACTLCARQGRKCIVSAKSEHGRCSECVRQGKGNCDAVKFSSLPSMGDWESLDRQQEKLQAEEEEAMAKILRLRKQQAFLRERKRAMVARGLQTLDELDEAEEKERREKEEAERAALPSSSDVSVDPVGDPGLVLPSDPNDPFWATLDLYGGMTPTTGGS